MQKKTQTKTIVDVTKMNDESIGEFDFHGIGVTRAVKKSLWF